MSASGVNRVWYGDGMPERMARAALAPAGWVYGGAVALRNALYDRQLLATARAELPALSVGNLSVGGTGKTPVAAWAGRALKERGAKPAIVLRGYGDDEPLVHASLNPDIPVVVGADRVRGVSRAHDGGADCVVLDDAFQHRRVARVADWVLVSAEQWRDDARSLPAGPLRETVGALRRATLVVVTRKTASRDDALAIAARLSRRVPDGASAIFHLWPDALVARDGARLPLSMLTGARVVAVAAIGAPAAFFRQLRELGAELDEVPLDDHHRFSASEAQALARRAEGTNGVVCTLKDAVKLAPLWRGMDAPLWYVSQAAVVDHGRLHLDLSLESVLTARAHRS